MQRGKFDKILPICIILQRWLPEAGSLLQKAFQSRFGVDVEELTSLVIRAQDGDMSAYSQIVQRFQDMAYGSAYAILGNFHLAEDAAQEALIEAYCTLPKLREPAAFPGWLRRIVFKQCDRPTRRKRPPTTALAAAAQVPSGDPGPVETVEQREMRDKVMQAIRALPGSERMAVTLFYINGYSQRDIAEFLDVPVTTVNNRLHISRKRLKERMISMVENTLKANAPDQRFSRRVIEELLARPRPLEINGHPVREIWQLIQATLPGYVVLEGEEVVPKCTYVGISGNVDQSYHVDESNILRRETTVVTMKAMAGRNPPIRLLTAGRVFRPDAEDAYHLQVFHQCDGLCVESGADSVAMKGTVERVLRGILGAVELRWANTTYTSFEDCLEVSVKAGRL